MNLKHVIKLRNKLKDEILRSSKEILIKFPVKHYIAYLESYPKICSYNHVIPEINDFCKNIIKYNNEQTLELYHKLILVNLILKAKDELNFRVLPNDIKKLYGKNFERIIKNIKSDANPPGFYKYPNDKFSKDLAICRLAMIPLGALKMNLSGIPRRFLFKKGLLQFFKGVIFVIFELGGFKPLYEMHIDSHDPDLMKEFNFEGRSRAYRRAAEILKMNGKIRGIFASGWFYDPQLEKISPRLNYVRELFLKNRGKLFYMGSSAHGIKDATLKSPTRRKLYLEGKYIPRDYMAIWSRKKLLDWANNYLYKS